MGQSIQRIDQVKSVEVSALSRPYSSKFFKFWLGQILRGPL